MSLASLRLRLPRLPIAIQFTRQGLIFVFLCLAIGAAAVNTGNNVLYLIFALMLGLIVVSGIVSRRILQGLYAQIAFPDQIFAGSSHPCYITVTNRKKSLPSIAVQFRIHQEQFPQISRYFFYIPSKTEMNAYAPAVFRRRGIFTIHEMELQTRFPFSFLVKIRRFFPNQTVRVYPRIFRLSDEIIARFTEGTFLESPYRGDSHNLLHLRDYTHQDSSKRIHWKASAKTEKLMVKDYQKEQGRDLFLYFDCYPTGGPELNPVLETALSLIASLALLLSEKGIYGQIVFPDNAFEIHPGAHMISFLDYLASVETCPANPRYAPPENLETVVLIIRSRKFPSKLTMQWPLSHVLYVEDWISALNSEGR